MINLTFFSHFLIFILFLISELGVIINMMLHDMAQCHIKAVTVTMSHNHVL